MQRDLTDHVFDEMTLAISPREEQLLLLVRQGFTNRDIAKRLDVREQTVKNALAVLFEKCHVQNRTQLAFVRAVVRGRNAKNAK